MFTIPTEKTAQNIIRNLVGYSIIALVVAVITLFGMYQNLNWYIRTTLMQSTVDLKISIDKNNAILYQVQVDYITNGEIARQQARDKGEASARHFIDSLDNVITDKHLK